VTLVANSDVAVTRVSAQGNTELANSAGVTKGMNMVVATASGLTKPLVFTWWVNVQVLEDTTRDSNVVRLGIAPMLPVCTPEIWMGQIQRPTLLTIEADMAADCALAWAMEMVTKSVPASLPGPSQVSHMTWRVFGKSNWVAEADPTTK